MPRQYSNHINKEELQLRKLKPVREYRGVEFIFTRDTAHKRAGFHKLTCLLNHFPIPDKPDFEGVRMQIMVWDTQNTYVEALAGRYGKPPL